MKKVIKLLLSAMMVLSIIPNQFVSVLASTEKVETPITESVEPNIETEKIDVSHFDVSSLGNSGINGKQLNNLRVTNGNISIDWVTDGFTGNTYEINKGYQTFLVSFSYPQTSNLVIVVEIPAYGIKFAALPNADGVVEELVKIDDRHVAFRVMDSTDVVSYEISFTILPDKISDDQFVQIINEGFVTSKVAATEYNYSGNLKNVLSDSSATAGNSAVLFNGTPSYSTDAEIVATHTYEYMVPFYSETGASYPNYVLHYAGRYRSNGIVYGLYPKKNGAIRFELPSAYGGTIATPMEVVSIRVYVPTDSAKTDVFNLKEVGDVTAEETGTTSDLKKKDFDTMWGSWSLSDKQFDTDGNAYYDITPSTRWFNSYNSSDFDKESIFAGLRLEWELVNEANSLTPDSIYSSSKKSVLTYRIAGCGNGIKTFEFNSPVILTEKKGIVEGIIDRSFNNYVRSWSQGTDLAHEVVIGQHVTNEFFNSVRNSGYQVRNGDEKTHYFPGYNGTVNQIYEFPYQIQPRKLYITENKQAVIGNPEKKPVLADVIYTYWDNSFVSVAETKPSVIADANNNIQTSNGTGTILELDLGNKPIKKVEIVWTRLSSPLHWQDAYNEGSNDTAMISFDYVVSGYTGPEETEQISLDTPWVQVQYTEKYDGSIPDFTPAESGAPSSSATRTGRKPNYFWFKLKPQMDPQLYGISPSTTNTNNSSNANYRINQLDNGTQNMGLLGFYIGEEGETKNVIKNPIITFGMKAGITTEETGWYPTYNPAIYDGYRPIAAFDGIADNELLAFLSGTFVANHRLAGWKFIYTSLNHAEETTYVVPDNISDGTEISILEDGDAFKTLKLVYEGEYNIVRDNPTEPGDESVVNEDLTNGYIAVLLQEIGLRRLNKNPFTNVGIKVATDYFMQILTLEASVTYEDGECNCEGHIHDRDKGQPYVTGTYHTTSYSQNYRSPIRAWLYATRKAGFRGSAEYTASQTVFTLRQGEGTANGNNNEGKNKGASFDFRLDARPESPFGNPSEAKSRFTADDYRTIYYRVDAFSPSSRETIFPYGEINEAVYIELADDEFLPDLHNTTWCGFSADSANIKAEIVTLDNGKRFLVMRLADGVVRHDIVPNNTGDTNNTSRSYAFLKETLKIAFNTLPGVALGEHHPIGDIYFDFAGLLEKYKAPNSSVDGNITKYVFNNAVEDVYGLSPWNATGVQTDKLFKVSGQEYTINIGVQLRAGADLAPGKETEYFDFNPRVTEFFPTDENNLNALVTIKGSASQEQGDVYDMAALFILPRIGTAIAYEKTVDGVTSVTTNIEEGLPTQFNMYLRGTPVVVSDSHEVPSYVRYSYTTAQDPTAADARYDFVPTTEDEWKQVTGVVIHVDVVKATKSLNIRLDLSSDTKNTVDILSAYSGGLYRFSTTAPGDGDDRSDTSDYQQGYMQLVEWQYKNIVLEGGRVFWDINNENGLRDNSYESYISNVVVELYDENNTLIDTTRTDRNGKFTLETYKTDANQYIVISNPNYSDTTVKLTKQKDESVAVNSYDNDSDFDRETYRLTFTTELNKKGLNNISAGFLRLPKATSAKDVYLAPGMTLEGEVLFREFIEAGTNTNNVLLNGGYTISYTVADPTIATVVAGTLSNPSTTYSGYSPYSQLLDKPAVTGVALGTTVCTVTVTNCLGDTVTQEFNIVVGKLEITAEDYEGVYDGQAHTGIYTPTFNNETVTEDITFLFSTDGGITWSEEEPTGTFVDDNENNANLMVKASHPLYGESDPDEYSIIIQPRPIVLVGASQSFKYDGKTHKNETVTAQTPSDLVAGDKIEAKATGSVKDVADTATGNNPVADGYKITRDDVDISTSYVITTVAGTLTVTRRYIVIRAGSDEKVYDGTALTCDSFTVETTADGLPEGETQDIFTVVMTPDSSITNVGTKANTIHKVNGVIVSTTGQTPIGNYMVMIAAGTLKVTKLDLVLGENVIITPYDGDYDGQYHSGSVKVVTSAGVDITDQLTITYYDYDTSEYLDGEPSRKDVYWTDAEGVSRKYYGVRIEGSNVSTYNNVNQNDNGYYIKINRIKLVLESATIEKVYDGLPLSNDNAAEFGVELLPNGLFKAEGFIEGEGIESVTWINDPAINVSDDKNNIFYPLKYKEGTKDVNYDVELKYGKLIIKPLEVTIKAASTAFRYNGTAQSDPTYTVSWVDNNNVTHTNSTGELIGNDKVEVTVSGEITFPSESPVVNTIGSIKLNGEEIPLSGGEFGNYIIKTEDGVLTMTGPTEGNAITIKGASQIWEYDGETHSNNKVEIVSGALFKGDELVAEATGSVTNVADNSAKNNPVAEGYKILHTNPDGKKTDVTDMYVITTEAGTLGITPRDIVVRSLYNLPEDGGEPFTYNGTAQSFPKYIVYSQRDNYTFEDGKLFGDDTIEVTVTGSITFPSETPAVNTIGSIKLNGEEIPLSGGTFGNYRIKPNQGRLIMGKASNEITIKGADNEWIYDGIEHTDARVLVSVGTLFEGDELVATATGKVTNVADTAEGNNPVAEGYKIMHGDVDVTENYVIKAEAGTLTIKKMPITLRSSGATKVYDGTPLTNDEVTVVGELPKGVTITFDVTGSQTIPGESPNTFTYTISKQRSFLMSVLRMFKAPAKEASEEDNYDITVEYGTLKITNRGEDPDDPDSAKYEVEFTAKSDEVTYDGKEHTVEGFTVDKLEYTNDKGIKYTITGITASGKGTNAGEYEVKVTGTPKVTDPDGNDVTSQFNVTAKDGKLVINTKEVTVTVKGKTDTKVYNGEEQKVEGYDITISDPLYTEADFTHPAQKDIYASGIDVGEYTMDLAVGMFQNNNDNFKVTFVVAEDGKLTITPKEVTVTAKDYTKNIGEDDPAFEATVEGLCGEDKVEYEIKREEGEEAGEYALTPEGEAEQGNYTVKFVAGTLTIVDNTPDTGDRTGIDFWYITMCMSMLCFITVLFDLKKRRLLA